MNTVLDSALISYGMTLIRTLILLGIAYYGTSWIERRVHAYLTRVYPDELRATAIARIISYAFLFVVIAGILHEFGLHLTAVLGAAGIIGFAMAYASQTSISNIISGLFLTIERPFVINDILLVDGIEGTLIATNLFAVTLRTPMGTIVRVPHEQLLKHTFTNLTRLPLRRHDVILKIDYQEQLPRVIEIIKQGLKSNKYCLHDPEPTIITQEISGHYVKIQVGAWARQEDIRNLQKTMLIDLKEAFDKNKVKMAVYLVGERIEA